MLAILQPAGEPLFPAGKIRQGEAEIIPALMGAEVAEEGRGGTGPAVGREGQGLDRAAVGGVFHLNGQWHLEIPCLDDKGELVTGGHGRVFCQGDRDLGIGGGKGAGVEETIGAVDVEQGAVVREI